MAADALITEAELEAYLQAPVDSAVAALAIAMATGAVQAAAGQRLVQVEDDVVILDLDRIDTGPYLELPEAPVTEVTTVLVGATTATGYTAELSRGRLYRATGWRSPTLPSIAPSTVTVTYTHGYALTDQDLMFARSVALGLAAAVVDNPNGATREQIDDYAVQYGAATAGLEVSSAMAAALRRRYGRGRRSALLIRD